MTIENFNITTKTELKQVINDIENQLSYISDDAQGLEGLATCIENSVHVDEDAVNVSRAVSSMSRSTLQVLKAVYLQLNSLKQNVQLEGNDQSLGNRDCSSAKSKNNKPYVHIESPADTPEKIFNQLLDVVNISFGHEPANAIGNVAARSKSAISVSTDFSSITKDDRNCLLWSAEDYQSLLQTFMCIPIKQGGASHA